MYNANQQSHTKSAAIKNESWHWTMSLFDWLGWDCYCNILIIFIYIVRLVSWNSKKPVGTEEMSYGLNIRKKCETLTVTEDSGYYVSSKNTKPDWKEQTTLDKKRKNIYKLQRE